MKSQKNRNNKRSLALLLGYSLAGLLLFAMLALLLQAVGLIDLIHSGGGSGPSQVYLQGGQVRSVDIRVHSGLTIRTGPELLVEARNAEDSFRCTLDDNGLLTISSDRPALAWLGNWRGAAQQVVVTLPEGAQLERAALTLGIDDLEVEQLDTRTLLLTGGVGDATFYRLTALESAKITVGVGDIEIMGGQLQDLNLEGGVGDFDCAAALLGSCVMENGVGDTDLTLPGSRQDYYIQALNGIGDVEIDGVDLKNGAYGDPAAPNRLNISNGVGDVEIEFGY